VDIDEVANLDGALIDARDPARYRGEGDPVDPRTGHIPGALSAPCRENLDGAGRFLSPGELRARFASLGITESTPVVSYCGSGVTACHNLLALEHAGLPRARLYPGSWSQWSADPEREVATGASP
jgi:thiosulfate/3-mercaptopyruvate sulfurtransferase